MSTYSVNQVRHLYVAKSLKTTTAGLVAAGDILPKADTGKSTMYFQYFSPAGVVESSDKVTIANITSAKATASGSMVKKLDRFQLVLSSGINSGAPVAGQDYITRIALRQYVGLSEEDQYFKYGSVYATTGMTASDFYKNMAVSLAKSAAKDISKPFKVYVKYTASGDQYTEVTANTTLASLTNTYTAIHIEQVAQDWILGTMPQGYIPFTVQPTTITYSGEEAIWGTVTSVASINSVQNGHEIADLEYFTMGFRGDIYRNVGFPNVIKTTYLVDPTSKYDVLDINYYFAGNAEDVQKSPRLLTIVTVDDGSHTAMNALINAINTASGLTIATL